MCSSVVCITPLYFCIVDVFIPTLLITVYLCEVNVDITTVVATKTLAYICHD